MSERHEFWSAEDHPGEMLGIRRHQDRCFHPVEEEVEEGYIVDGILVPRDEIAEVTKAKKSDPGGQGCRVEPE